MRQIPTIQPARWSRNGVRIVVVPGAELPRFRLEMDPAFSTTTAPITTALFSTVEEAESAAEAIVSSAEHRISA